MADATGGGVEALLQQLVKAVAGLDTKLDDVVGRLARVESALMLGGGNESAIRDGHKPLRRTSGQSIASKRRAANGARSRSESDAQSAGRASPVDGGGEADLDDDESYSSDISAGNDTGTPAPAPSSLRGSALLRRGMSEGNLMLMRRDSAPARSPSALAASEAALERRNRRRNAKRLASRSPSPGGGSTSSSSLPSEQRSSSSSTSLSPSGRRRPKPSRMKSQPVTNTTPADRHRLLVDSPLSAVTPVRKARARSNSMVPAPISRAPGRRSETPGRALPSVLTPTAFGGRPPRGGSGGPGSGGRRRQRRGSTYMGTGTFDVHMTKTSITGKALGKSAVQIVVNVSLGMITLIPKKDANKAKVYSASDILKVEKSPTDDCKLKLHLNGKSKANNVFCSVSRDRDRLFDALTSARTGGLNLSGAAGGASPGASSRSHTASPGARRGAVNEGLSTVAEGSEPDDAADESEPTTPRGRSSGRGDDVGGSAEASTSSGRRHRRKRSYSLSQEGLGLLKFDVQYHSSGVLQGTSHRTLVINVLAKQFSFIHKLEKKDFEARELVFIHRSRTDATKLKVGLEGHAKSKSIFCKSPIECERVFQALWWLKYPSLVSDAGQRTQDVKVFCFTWNMGDADPPASLVGSIPEVGYDILAIGSQECALDPDVWFGKVRHHFSSDEYVVLATHKLWNIRLIVMIRADLQFYVTEVEVANVSTGVGGIAGNKGGVGVSLQLGETTMCFVCCHLAAHQEHVPQRNADFREISKSMALGFKELDLSNQFDILFWMGDVNYRIDLDKPTVLDLIAAGDFETLLAADQLGIERSHGNAFAGFSEGDIAFPPTYRYQRGSREYTNTAKERVPSWCDRVLWKAVPSRNVTLRNYDCCDEITTSDHSPVFAALEVEVLLPYRPVSWDGDFRTCEILIRDMRARVSSSSANVWVEFFGLGFLERGLWKTTTSGRSRTGFWSWDSVPAMLPFFNEPDFLAARHLIAVVREKKEVVGAAFIPLRDACAGPSAFAVKLLREGHYTGDIQGSVEVVWMPFA